MTIRIDVHLGIGLGDAAHNDMLEVEVDDGSTPAEIELASQAEFYTWLQGYIEAGWSFAAGGDRGE